MSVVSVANCATLAAMFPAQIQSETSAVEPATTSTTGTPVELTIVSFVSPVTAALTTGANAQPKSAAPTPTAASFLILKPLMFCFTSQFFYNE